MVLTPLGNPDYAAAQSSLARALLLDQQPADAAQAFAAAAAPPATPDPDLLYNWSLALLRAGSPAKAAEVLDRIPAADRNEETLTLSVDISERLGHFQQALATSRQPHSRTPPTPTSTRSPSSSFATGPETPPYGLPTSEPNATCRHALPHRGGHRPLRRERLQKRHPALR